MGTTGTPLIAVTGRRRSARGMRLGPPVLDRLELDLYFTGYAEQVVASGGIALHVPSGADAAALIERVDGLVLTGGSDVDPARFGAPPADRPPEWGPVDPERDAFELALLDAALATDRPVLAICRGLQLANVALGGTLHTHLPQHPGGGRHEVTVEPGSELGRLHGPATSVNSLHHQGVDQLGRGLVVTARAADGVIEGVELPGRLLGVQMVCVQWHPEQLDGPQPVFRWLVEAARTRVGVPHHVTS